MSDHRPSAETSRFGVLTVYSAAIMRPFLLYCSFTNIEISNRYKYVEKGPFFWFLGFTQHTRCLSVCLPAWLSPSSRSPRRAPHLAVAPLLPRYSPPLTLSVMSFYKLVTNNSPITFKGCKINSRAGVDPVIFWVWSPHPCPPPAFPAI